MSSGLKLPVISGEPPTPIAWNVLTIAPDAVGQGTWVRLQGDASRIMAGVMYDSSSTDGDEFDINFRCPAGTYTLFFGYEVHGNRGIIDIDVDSVEKGSIDTYDGGGQASKTVAMAGIVIAEGAHILTVRVDGKNGSSTDYLVAVEGFALQRTA